MTFQKKILRFDKITKSMYIPEKYREINAENIKWLAANLQFENAGHRHYEEAMRMIMDWNNQISNGDKHLR